MSYTAKFKGLNRPEQLSIVFYIVSAALLLALLPFSGFAPHLAVIGIFSIITGAIVLAKRGWALWFIIVQGITALVFAFWTIFTLVGSNWPVSLVLMVYAALEFAAMVSLTILPKARGL